MEARKSSSRTLSLHQINYQTLSEIIPKSGKLYVGHAGHYYAVRPWGVCRFVVVRRGQQILLRLHGGRGALLSWYPDGRVVVGGIVKLYKGGEGVGVPVEFWRLIDRSDLFEVMEGDVYINDQPIGDAKLLSREEVVQLERQVNYLANQLLHPQTRYDWWCCVFRQKQNFILQPREGNLAPDSLSFFNQQMHQWCQASGIELPKRSRKPVSGLTADSCIQSLLDI